MCMQEMKIVLGENLKVEAHYKGFKILTDQPSSDGGDNSAPSPFDLFLASVGACAGYYVKAYCRQRGISEQGIHLTQTMHRDRDSKMISRIEINIVLPPDFPRQHIQSVVRAAEACTVKKHIAAAPGFVLNTTMAE